MTASYDPETGFVCRDGDKAFPVPKTLCDLELTDEQQDELGRWAAEKINEWRK